MRKIVYILLCGICVCEISLAQRLPDELNPRNYPNGVAIVSDSELLIRAADISVYEVLDTAYCIASYNFTHPNGSRKTGTDKGERMTLEIGESKTAFYSLDLLGDDSLITYEVLQKGKYMTLSANRVRYHVYGDIKRKCFEVMQRIPFSSGVAVVIEDLQIPQWQIDTLKCNILGYSCYRATATFKGRGWSVWFTPEIPLSIGPWKLWGLPGLVLKAEDAQRLFSFDCLEIEQRNSLIKKYKWKYSSMDQRDWLKFEKRMHDTPFATFGQNTLILGIGEHSGRLDQTWETPYFPLELE